MNERMRKEANVENYIQGYRDTRKSDTSYR